MTKATGRNGRLAGAALVVALAASGIAAAAPAGAQAIADSTGEQRFVITVPLTAGGAQAAGRMPHDGFGHRIAVELFDAQGGAHTDARFEIALFMSATGEIATPLARLHTGAPGFALPKPLGFRFGAGDSLHVTATVGPGAAAGLVARITIDYEAADRATRLPVVPLELDGSTPPDGRTRTWEWHGELATRVLAFAGAQLAAACELVLEDAVSGEVLWRLLPQRAGPGYGSGGDIVRLGAVLAAGRTYRLHVTYDDDGQLRSSEATPLRALVLAPRAPLLLAGN
jgi:hypothetical protein